jgi:hypothetical protein
VLLKVYGDFYDLWAALEVKNKANQTQSQLAPSTAVGLKNQLKKQSQS